MNVTDTLKKIYSGPFSKYLSLSASLEILIQEQSKLVNSLFKLHINLLQIWQKYKKPVYPEQEDIFTEPIAKQISILKKFTTEHESENGYLRFIGQFVDIFWWMKYPEVEKYMDNINGKIIEHKHQLKSGTLCSDSSHSDWLEAWIETLEEFSSYILTNFKNGLTWTGSEKLPTQVVPGDMATNCRNSNQTALLKEINRGENITTRVLRHREDDGAGVSPTAHES